MKLRIEVEIDPCHPEDSDLVLPFKEVEQAVRELCLRYVPINTINRTVPVFFIVNEVEEV